MKIDLVYLWCDGNATLWIAKKNRFLTQEKQVELNAANDCRFIDNEELRYSLRSVEMYAPWVNRIFIITDAQTPHWLDTTHPKIKIIDHRELFTPEQLPLFNSVAIEQRIAHIQGLSEHFIYANDDMMFANPTSPSYFFTPKGQPIFRLVKVTKKQYLEIKNDFFFSTIISGIDAIKQDFGRDFEALLPSHQIDAYQKSSILQCLEQYKAWSLKTISHRFRHGSDMQRHLFSLFAIATGQMKLETYGAWRFRFINLLLKLKLIKHRPFLHVELSDTQIMNDLKKYKPHLICFNDTEASTNEDRQRLKELLPQLYPNPSSFEWEQP